MILKIIIVALLMIVLYSLGSALFFMLRDKGQSTRMVKALTWRISLSLALFVFIIIAYLLGWIAPHGLFVG